MAQEQVLRELSEDMIFLGIMGESGIVWELVKSNDLNPTKRRLYKEVRVYIFGGWFFREGREE